jgi:hypothetical protein
MCLHAPESTGADSAVGSGILAALFSFPTGSRKLGKAPRGVQFSYTILILFLVFGEIELS